MSVIDLIVCVLELFYAGMLIRRNRNPADSLAHPQLEQNKNPCTILCTSMNVVSLRRCPCLCTVLGNIFYTISYQCESAINPPLGDTAGAPALYLV
jgi:hypothetical protein